ncbi:MAG TPA: thiamine pyrophosphate-binding protein [Streptosporangiaceae bacterium]|nr:thiamine pyrophosphate-binding protein [Streptosporangiaceae bacterium]
MNPSTALATVVVDELIRCGLREAVLAPGSRSAPLALELYRRAQAGDLRLHVRLDERSAAFTALGLAKASRCPVAVVCTSGTAAAHFHAAVIEADEAGLPLIALTADRPPELRGTGANQTIDQLKLYGSSVRWFCEVGVPEQRAGMAGYWRSAAGRAWGLAAGSAGGAPGPVHLNLALREPLVPDVADVADVADGVVSAHLAAGEDQSASSVGQAEPGPVSPAAARRPGRTSGPGRPVVPPDGWPDELAGRPGGSPWTRFGTSAELAWTERGLIVCGDGDYDPGPLLELAAEAGWPVLAEPSSGARSGPNALPAYQYLLAAPGFVAAHRPDVIVSAGRPGLSRGQLALLRAGRAARHLVIAQGPGRWADPARTATDVVAAVRLAAPAGPAASRPAAAAPAAVAGPPAAGGPPAGPAPVGWLAEWLRADQAARSAVDAILDAEEMLSEPRLARDLAAGLPDGAMLWAASSLPIRDLDQQLAPRTGLRILASRGASGIDGLVSSAIGAALAHQASGGGPAVALLGDLALLHDAAGLILGPDEPRPDLCLIVVNNDGGGIFSLLEQAAIPGPFERVFGTPHGTRLGELAAAAGLPFRRLERPADLARELSALAGRTAGTGAGQAPGVRLVELRTDRADQAALRTRLAQAAVSALATTLSGQDQAPR